MYLCRRKLPSMTQVMLVLIDNDMMLQSEAGRAQMENEVERMRNVLPEHRVAEAMRYKHMVGQYTCLKSYEMLLSLGLSSNPWQHKEYGKPFIEGCPAFSLSHSKTAIAVAVASSVAEGEIGIDIECIDRRLDDGLIRRTMNDEEQHRIALSDDKARAFIRLWTQKESYLKYVGTGIIDDLTGALNAAREVALITYEPADRNYICTLCVGLGSVDLKRLIAGNCQTTYIELRFGTVKGRVVEIVNAILGSLGLEQEEDLRLRLALEEPIENIAMYAYEGDAQQSKDQGVTVRIHLADEWHTAHEHVEIELCDRGIPFDPMETNTLDMHASIGERPIGGLGIFMTRQIMHELRYRYEDGQNKLSLLYRPKQK